MNPMQRQQIIQERYNLRLKEITIKQMFPGKPSVLWFSMVRRALRNHTMESLSIDIKELKDLVDITATSTRVKPINMYYFAILNNAIERSTPRDLLISENNLEDYYNLMDETTAHSSKWNEITKKEREELVDIIVKEVDEEFKEDTKSNGLKKV